jgi:hypothetical protein
MLLVQLTADATADATTCKLVKPTQRCLQAVLLLTQSCLNIWSLSQAGALLVLDVGVELVLLELESMLLAENAVWCGAVRCAHESTFCDYSATMQCEYAAI